MSYIIRFESLAGVDGGGAHDAIGNYLRNYDPTPLAGRPYDGGLLKTTRFRHLAQLFESPREAIECWRTQAPPPHDLRPDGKPNRPLTPFSVSILEEK
jgi:hypothetical protein